MLGQIFFITTVSLFDSLSTTQQIIIFVLLLTTVNPIRNSLSYLSGLFLAYFTCGVIGFMALDKLTAFVSRLLPVPSGAHMVSDAKYYQAQAFVGLIFAAIGVVYYQKKKHLPQPKVENIIISKLRNMNVFVAFLIGAFTSASSFPMSLPYIAALGKFALLKMSMPQVVACLVLYNVIYALPMVVIFIGYMFALGKGEGIQDRLHEKARRLNLQLTSGMFVAMGLFAIADSIVFFIFGHPILKNKFF